MTDRYASTRGSSGPLMRTTGMGVDQITRAWRMTASDFCRISRATSNGSPCWNFGRNSSTDSGPAYPLSASLRRIFDERRDAVAGNDPRGVVEQLARHIRHVLEVHVPDLAGANQIEVLELALSPDQKW